MALRYSQLKDKPKHRLKALMTKFDARIGELNTIVINSRKLGIPISEEAKAVIEQKILYYYSEHFKVSQVRKGITEEFINFKK